MTRPIRLVLANPPFAGSLDYENIAKDLQQVVKTKKTELLFLALFLRLLKPGGRAAVIVPDGVLFGSTKAHKELRRILVEDQQLDGVVSLPSGRVQALRRRVDGHPAVHEDRTRVAPTTSGSTTSPPTAAASTTSALRSSRRRSSESFLRSRSPTTEHAKNNLPDVLAHWARACWRRARRGPAPTRASASPRPTSSPMATTSASTATRRSSTTRSNTGDPGEILEELAVIEDDIRQGLADLEAML